MTVTVSIKENTGFGVIWGWHSQKCIPEDHPPSCTEAHGDPGHQPALLRWPWAAPQLLQTGLCWVKSRALSERAEHPAQEAFWLAKHTAPCEETMCHPRSRLPTLSSSTWVIHRQQVRYYGAEAQQPKAANKLPSIKCKNSRLGWLQQKKVSERNEIFLQWAGLSTTENKVRTAPAPPSQIFVNDLFCSHIFCSVTPVTISSCHTNTHTEYVTQQLNKFKQAPQFL